MTQITRRAALLLSAACMALSSTVLMAQTYPSKPIEWVVPYPAGGGTDVVARTLAEAMSQSLAQPIIVNNKPGAATNIGADYTARAKPDGYTLLSADTATLAANPFLYTKLSYDAQKDLAPVGLSARFPLILVVNPKVPAGNWEEFLAWAKTQDGANFASPGAGSPHHLATELLRLQAGLTLTHVPYRGAAPAVQDVVGGQVPFMFVDTAIGQQFINTGRLKPIGVASAQRVKNFESIATLQEQGLDGFEAYAWQGVAVPAKTPQAIVDQLNTALVDTLNSPEVQEKLISMGLELTPSTAAQMLEYSQAERAKWGEVIQRVGIKLD
ncbi:Bug family tripartite tricarboxylate transporter substrate binding protein [Lampropedia aestuarii]|uniref:Bug family tripartite tricarboxylate transporter substrate binding protein n=1 Tax=Lampropedia aestuarii TaxID=2562762 RepID=UPI002468EB00|nr:tripartite tricarboxylate transporter substrate binding protein [Lampropedia aestuarii]MDH5857464.1 tripartite tricarboxylate transporter substrate binding protein [Lampropedia aestuarii]